MDFRKEHSVCTTAALWKNTDLCKKSRISKMSISSRRNGHLGTAGASNKPPFGATLGHLFGSWGQLGPTWPTWANLGPTWANLGQLGANLGPTWGQLGANLGQLGANLGQLGANLGPTWANLGPASLSPMPGPVAGMRKNSAYDFCMFFV